MRALALVSAFLAVCVCTAASCAPAPAQTEPALWRIADDDSEIWLFGTVHVLPPDLRWRGPRVNAAFAAAEEFVTETDIGQSAEIQALAQRLGALPVGENLSAVLGAEAPRFARVTQGLGLEPQAFERTRPWLVALQLSLAYAIRRGHSGDAGVESVLTPEAVAAGKTLSYLETPEQQLRVLADFSPADERQFLVATLDEIEHDDGQLEAMDSAWARGDVAELTRLLDAEWRETPPAAHEAVILNRNRQWAEAIAQRLAGSGRAFVAVGAAHLVGDGSVVALLRARGIEVEGP